MSIADAEAMVRLVSQACDPTVSATVTERRSALCRDLAHLVGADYWIGAIGMSKEDDPSDSGIIGLYDGGWDDARQRIEFISICSDKSIN